jgi:hypothetical protein
MWWFVVLAVVGWSASVCGAVLGYRGRMRGSDGGDDGTFTLSWGDHPAWWSLALVIVGATCGLVGTVCAAATR